MVPLLQKNGRIITDIIATWTICTKYPHIIQKFRKKTLLSGSCSSRPRYTVHFAITAYAPILVSQSDIIKISFFQCCDKFAFAIVNKYLSKLWFLFFFVSGIIPNKNIWLQFEMYCLEFFWICWLFLYGTFEVFNTIARFGRIVLALLWHFQPSVLIHAVPISSLLEGQMKSFCQQLPTPRIPVF